MIRREALLSLGQAGVGALTLPTLLAAERALAAPVDGVGSPMRPQRAKSCIFLFLWGGPPQQDLWDLKPEAPSGIRSLFRPIATAVPGASICELMPRQARVMDRLAIVRSLHHESADHGAGSHWIATGFRPGQDQPRANERPGVGSIVASSSPFLTVWLSAIFTLTMRPLT